ncbi:MAG: methylated-DNA--[protein]-cysteine S-methyltransferase [Planctomycetes bacterium]|nr:methylated-DNA--[protein]-cysteine S-methyltransferase [Planctomycetota bacterium]
MPRWYRCGMRGSPPETTFTLRTPHGPLQFRCAGASPTWLRRMARVRLGGRAVGQALQRLPEGTPFQRRCWQAASRIPAGQTRTYAWLARAAGSPAATRAAAQAMRRNPWPLLIPCHRVVGVRDLGGYAGTRDPASRRLDLKRWLLEREATGRGRNQ